jgi:hypothetical protein
MSTFMGLSCNSLSSGELAIVVEDQAEERIVCKWRGRSVERDPGHVLSPYFDQLLDVAHERRAAVEMRFDSLEHFNSSTIATLIRFIQNARGRGIRLVLFYDPSLKWQRLSFEALRVLDKNDQLFQLVSV